MPNIPYNTLSAEALSEYFPVVIYARYSSQGQREESIEGQLRECRAFADRNGWTVVGEYIDRALSGKTDKRDDFQRMIVPFDAHADTYGGVHPKYQLLDSPVLQGYATNSHQPADIYHPKFRV